MRSRFWIPSAAFVVGLLLLLSSCSGNPNTGALPATLPTTVAPSAAPTAGSSAKPAAPLADLNDPTQVDAGSWTDDEAIRALANDCKWDPAGCIEKIEIAAHQSIETIDYVPDGYVRTESDTRMLPEVKCQGLQYLACAQVPGQMCAPDECSQTDYNCIPACDDKCTTCASQCVAGCEACKSKCTDETCRFTCAKSCGECRNGCLRALDQCASTHCSEEGENCFRTRDDEWNKSVCPKVCPKVQACVEKCPPIENDYSGELYRGECANKCLAKFGKGCPSRFDRICAGDPNASVNFFAYHFNRAESGK